MVTDLFGIAPVATGVQQKSGRQNTTYTYNQPLMQFGTISLENHANLFYRKTGFCRMMKTMLRLFFLRENKINRRFLPLYCFYLIKN